MENKIIDIAWIGSSTAFAKKFGTTLPRYVDANKNVIYWCCSIDQTIRGMRFDKIERGWSLNEDDGDCYRELYLRAQNRLKHYLLHD